MSRGTAARMMRLAAAAAVFLAIGFLSARFAQSIGPASSAAAAPALDVPGVESIVDRYIRTHPETIVAALDAERARHALQAQFDASAAIRAHRAELFADRASPTLG